VTTPPDRPKIYHITHVANLAGIIADGGLVSDREMIERGGPAQAIGMSEIKRRRVEELDVRCHPGTKVGDYVPFYYCPRSIMLYVIYRRNHPELTYRGGQGPIIHLEADLHGTIRWANARGIRWAVSRSNAGTYAVQSEFRSDVDSFEQLDWNAIAATDFRAPDVRDGKQAEFLLHDRFPFELVERIGVQNAAVAGQAKAALRSSSHRPPVEVRPGWYF